MSPIKGLSDKRRLPRLGKIHLGFKDPAKNGAPTATDYFVCPPEVEKVFNEKPKELRILIPIEDEDKWASQYYRAYSKTRGLICKGDGENCLRMVDTKTGDLANKDSKEVVLKELSCKGKECPDYINKKCREMLNLQFLIPEVPGLGVWQIDTSSINSILNINAAADLIRRLYGRVSMIPLLLTIEPQSVKTPEGTQRIVHVLNLRTKETLYDMMQLALKPVVEALLPATEGEAIPLEAELPTPDNEIPDLIIPENQAPKGEEPKIKTPQVISPTTDPLALPKPVKKDRISLSQIKEIYGTAGKMGYTEQAYKDLLKVNYGMDDTRRLTKEQGQDFRQRLERGETVEKERGEKEDEA